MLRALETNLHSLRLSDLIHRFRAQELALATALKELQAECDVIAIELAHVRLAMHGANEELASCSGTDCSQESIPA